MHQPVPTSTGLVALLYSKHSPDISITSTRPPQLSVFGVCPQDYGPLWGQGRGGASWPITDARHADVTEIDLGVPPRVERSRVGPRLLPGTPARGGGVWSAGVGSSGVSSYCDTVTTCRATWRCCCWRHCWRLLEVGAWRRPCAVTCLAGAVGWPARMRAAGVWCHAACLQSNFAPVCRPSPSSPLIHRKGTLALLR